MNKNKELLDNFIAYCEQHPEERFWQALRNWAGVSFILAANTYSVPHPEYPPHEADIRDTFYWKNKNN